MKQRQFLDVIDEAEAHRRFDDVCAGLRPRAESVPLGEALGRVLFEDVRTTIDVPGFDRSNVDGFAVRAMDTFGAVELEPVVLDLHDATIPAGVAPQIELGPGEACTIATGAVLPRGADAVVMVEDSAPRTDAPGRIEIQRAVVPGANLTSAGTDVGRGETVLRGGVLLSSRETGLLAAIGLAQVLVHARPRVAVLSTGDEVRAPGEALGLGEVYDSNGRILCDAVRELGGEAIPMGILPDDEATLAQTLTRLLVASANGDERADVVLLSGGTSKGAGDLNHRVVARLAKELAGSRGIVVHGVALKPGKPLCLAHVAESPVVILPGFPTSAIFTFHEFVAPLVRRLAGRREDAGTVVEALAPLRIASAAGRTEYCLVDLVPSRSGIAAYPIGSGSGSVSTFSRADGFVRIDASSEYVPEGARVQVRALGGGARPADLIAIGSHCIGLDFLLSRLAAEGFSIKMIPVGSQAGLRALARGEGDVAGVHLLDAESGTYNTPFLEPGMSLIEGYGRRQGIVYRSDDERLRGATLDELRAVTPRLRMINRNPGSGTSVLIDEFLECATGEEPAGYTTRARSHHAVAAAVAQGRADWGVTLDTLAESAGLSFCYLTDERFDIAVRGDRASRPAVVALTELLHDRSVRDELRESGLMA